MQQERNSKKRNWGMQQFNDIICRSTSIDWTESQQWDTGADMAMPFKRQRQQHHHHQHKDVDQHNHHPPEQRHCFRLNFIVLIYARA